MRNNKKLQEYYMTCKEYFLELSKKDFNWWFSSYHSTLKAKDDPILDVGCGVGQVVNRLADGGFYAVGIDISPVGIQIASNSGKGTFVIASASNLPFRNDSFASLGFYDFLEHTYDPDICLKELVRVLKQDGKIVLLAPNFLRVIGLSTPHHWHMKGFSQRMSNFFNLLRKAIHSKLSYKGMQFEFMHPQFDSKGKGGDLDAVCVTNPIDIKSCLKKLGIKILKESSAPNWANGTIGKIGELPLFRSMAGFTFLIGIKTDTGTQTKKRANFQRGTSCKRSTILVGKEQ